MADEIFGTAKWDRAILGSGAQTIDTGADDDRIISYADAGEPDPAQTSGALGRVTDPVPAADANDILTGGAGADRFEFRALIDAKQEVITEHSSYSGWTDWANVAGENDSVHDHWVNGFGLDTITDFSKAEGDTIAIIGHTVSIDSITYGSDRNGEYSLITVISQQGAGGAGGANTETGAHDEDSLGQIKVYGDKVTENDLTVQTSNEGIDRLHHADQTYGGNSAGITPQVYSNSDGTNYDGILAKQTDRVHIGEGRQTVDAGGGRDYIYSYSDGGEPDPAQTDVTQDRVNLAIEDGAADDIVAGGQGKDTFAFRLLLNAKEEVLEEHTRTDGSIRWSAVAGENDNVHDHWIEGIGNDTILDFSKQDRDQIDIRGHTVEIASITYDKDAGGDYSLISLRSQQGDGGGAHDEDSLGSIKVYGDRVDEGDINLRADVTFGVDWLDGVGSGELEAPASTPERIDVQPQWGAANPEDIDLTFEGSDRYDNIKAGSGKQTVNGGDGGDRLISYGDAGEPDPAQTSGAGGRINDPIPAGASDDVFTGGGGDDRFEFHALLNATAAVIAEHTSSSGNVDWRKVAGENDNVHDHWVEGFGNDTITDYNEAEGDEIIIRGHTVEIADITYGTDGTGSYSLIEVISQQGNGKAGGANTETGAHDEDSLGTIRVYGDKVSWGDVTVQANGVFDGMDRLTNADRLADYNGGSQQFESSTNGEVIVTSPDDVETRDRIEVGSGSQTVLAGAGRDYIYVYADGGEPDPAQGGADGRIDPPVDAALSTDIISGGQGMDQFLFNFLLNGTDEVLARFTREDGSIKWKKVAGENDAVHDHWVEGIGDDVLLDYSKQDGDTIIFRGHTVEIAGIEYGADDGGDYSLISIRSQQGDGGAHDEDSLGTLKVYGDTVTAEDITVKAAGIFDGIDRYEPLEDRPAIVYGTDDTDTLTGSAGADIMHGERDRDVISAGAGDDFVFGGGSSDIIMGESGDDWLEGDWGWNQIDGGAGMDTLVSNFGFDKMTGGADADTFMFKDFSRGGVVLDWQDGTDKLDLSRLDNVDEFADIDIVRDSEMSSTIGFENDHGQLLEVSISSNTAFELTQDDFII